jgi:hypothetical protein
MNSLLFTYRDKIEGKVGIGKLPNELVSILDDISNEYYNILPDKSSSTYHTYYNDLTSKLKEKFDKIQYNKFWDGICENTNCIKHCVTEMNEIYYSNPKPNFEKQNLYGAAANLIPHRDCILYNFNGIRFYRIIIGLTDSNNDTLTEFINLNLEHKINRGDYMIFDFDRTLHQVKKSGHVSPTPGLISLNVSSRRSINARAVTISETNKPAPCSLHNLLKAALVIPAIGARTTGVLSITSLFSKLPLEIGRRRGLS